MLTRRSLLGASVAALGARRVPRLARSSDALRVGVAGLNGRGAEHLAALRALPDVRVVALCDVDEQVLARELRKMRERRREVEVHVDLRRLLERDDVDALVLATPNHWHALQTIWACQAGKDVFVESPVTHAFAEGARVASAARAHSRIVQSGLQARASPALAAAIEWVRAESLGALELVRALDYEARPSIGKTKENRRVPEVVDYDLWCGPAPLVPLRRAELHRDWRWNWGSGDGELGNRAAHVLDVARWVLGAEALPHSVLSLGARLGYADDGETPNTQLVHYAFEPVPLVLEVRGLPASAKAQAGDWSAGMDDYLGVRVGVVVHCERGTLRIHLDAPGSGAAAIAYDDQGKEIRRWEERGECLSGWLAACRTRRAEELAAGIEVGVRSGALVHLGNVSQRVGGRLACEGILEGLAGLETLRATCQRMLAHLDQNGIDLLKDELVLGPRLVLDPEQGVVRDNERANALLAGKYREPFVLPGA